MHGWIALILILTIFFTLRRRGPTVIVRGGIPVGADSAPRPWFVLLMIALIFGAILLCAGCSKPITQCTQ